MSAGTWNLTIEQGATFTRTLTIKDSSAAVVDLTGYTFAGKIRKSYASQVIGTFVFTILTQSGGTKGQVTMALTAATTAALPIESDDPTTDYVYDVTMTSPGSIVDRILEGTATVDAGVTR